MQDDSGQASCVKCEAGYLSAKEGATACTACAAGKFQRKSGEVKSKIKV